MDLSSHDVYVADTGNHRIEKFDESGGFLAAWGWGVSDGLQQSEVCTLGCQAGIEGSEAGQFASPTAIAVDNSGGASSGDVYVGEESTTRVMKFSSSGAYLGTIEPSAMGSFGPIYGIFVDEHGNLWVYDASGEVYEFGPSGMEIQQWSTGFGANLGLAVDNGEDVFAARGSKGMLEFTAAGVFQGELDEAEQNETGMAVDPGSGALLSDQGTFIDEYMPPIVPSSVPAVIFGEGELTAGTYLAVDPASEHLFVVEANGEVDIFGAPPEHLPEVKKATVASVSAESAILRLNIATAHFDTRYYVEYGTSGYQDSAPIEPGEIKSNVKEATVEVHLEGLAPETSYGYRVVAKNRYGEVVVGEGRRFTTFPLDLAGLPDARTYELVSPVEKNGGEVGVEGQYPGQASSDGDAINYASLTPFAAAEPQSGKIDEYVSRRGETGWTTQGISPRVTSVTEASSENPYGEFSEDLTEGIVSWEGAQLAPEASLGQLNLYVAKADGTYELVTIGSIHKTTPQLVGASKDLKHVVFEVNEALVPGAVSESKNVYEWNEGRLALVSIPPGSESGAPVSSAGYQSADLRDAVSSDGDEVFWSDGQEQLYMYRAGHGSTTLNVSTRIPSEGDGQAVFEGATPNGERVFFFDSTPLTDDAGEGGGLYEYDTRTGTLTLLTPVQSGEAGSPELVGISEDGLTVYLVAQNALKTTLAPVSPTGPAEGEPNLYVEQDGQLGFIVTLSSRDEADWARQTTSRQSALTPNGNDVVFTSVAPLTGYDNTDLNTGEADAEIFMYDLSEKRISCLSCDPSGAAPIGSSSVPGWVSSSYDPGYLSNDGSRVFFNSVDALTSSDTNGVQDVYEWERAGAGGCARAGGCVQSITTGTSAYRSILMAADASASNVFFVTRSKLVNEDLDEKYDVYDARIEGGFPSSPTLTPCSGEACLGPLGSPPARLTPLSTIEPFSVESAKSGVSPRSVRRSTLSLAAFTSRALRRFARTDRLVLTASVSQAGTVSARATARIGGRARLVGVAKARASKPGKLKLKLKLDRAARSYLRAGHALKLTIAVRYSKLARARRVTVVLHRTGRQG